MRAIVASAAVLVPAARAQTTANRGPVNDSLFAADAAAGGLAQLSFSGIGLPKATDPGPRTFSQQMIDVHARLNQELTTLAAQKQIALPARSTPGLDFAARVSVVSRARTSTAATPRPDSPPTGKPSRPSRPRPNGDRALGSRPSRPRPCRS